jgi:hypothetical protein
MAPATPPITADKFISGIPNFDTLSVSQQTDLLALYLLEHSGASEITASGIDSLRVALHLAPHSRLAQYLSEQVKRRRGRTAGKYIRKQKGYALERGAVKKLESDFLGRRSAVNVSASLRGTLSAIGDPAVRAYLDETVACYENNLLRSTIVLSWCVAYGLFRSWLFRNHLPTLNAAMAAWKQPFQIKVLDDFQELNESVVIDTAKKTGLITKEQFKTLKQALDIRNSFAHPTAKLITPAIAEAYLETILKEIMPVYG